MNSPIKVTIYVCFKEVECLIKTIASSFGLFGHFSFLLCFAACLIGTNVAASSIESGASTRNPLLLWSQHPSLSIDPPRRKHTIDLSFSAVIAENSISMVPLPEFADLVRAPNEFFRTLEHSLDLLAVPRVIILDHLEFRSGTHVVFDSPVVILCRRFTTERYATLAIRSPFVLYAEEVYMESSIGVVDPQNSVENRLGFINVSGADGADGVDGSDGMDGARGGNVYMPFVVEKGTLLKFFTYGGNGGDGGKGSVGINAGVPNGLDGLDGLPGKGADGGDIFVVIPAFQGSALLMNSLGGLGGVGRGGKEVSGHAGRVLVMLDVGEDVALKISDNWVRRQLEPAGPLTQEDLGILD
jgi:hypothetical protein